MDNTRCVRSTSQRRKAISSPHRRPVNAAANTSTRNRSGISSARASTCATVAVIRSGARCSPAPLIRHGLRLIRPSSTAVLKIARSNLYALAARSSDHSSRNSVARQLRMVPVEHSTSSIEPRKARCGYATSPRIPPGSGAL